jgi:hypothetical protein
VASASTAAAEAPTLGTRNHQRLTPNLAVALLAAGGCASQATFTPVSGAETATTKAASGERPGARDANLAGGRCKQGPGQPCACRDKRGDPAEQPPPDEGHKRFEIRVGAEGGYATLDSPTLGHFSARGIEACYYVDVVPGTTSDVTFVAKESWPGQGLGPTLEITEYGPKGPWWYPIVHVHCSGPGGRCNRDAADAWGADIKTRKRGRIDPCGSTVVTHLNWNTTGGAGDPELGLFRDFTVTFTMEVKRFPTQFRPGSTECVPK